MKTREINKSYKYRIYPTSEQIKYLNNNIGASRFIFNHIKSRYEFYKKEIQRLNLKPIYANRKLFNQILKGLKEQYSFLKEVDSVSLQKAYDRLIAGYKNISHGAGYVKFKSRKNPVQSFKTINIKIIDGKLKIPKLKSLIKMKYSQKIKGDILTGTIIYENNRWFVSINCKKIIVKEFKKTGLSVGVDLGIKDMATFSNGFKTGKIKFDKLDEKIGKYNKVLSRRIRGSNNWYKAKTKLNNAYYRKKETIKDFLHKLTTKIVKDFDNIIVGDVNSQLGLKNKRLARTTADQHWYEFKRQLEYKADWYGKYFQVIDEKNTSKTCSNCGYVRESINLNVRSWICPECNKELDRDINASINILNRWNSEDSLVMKTT